MKKIFTFAAIVLATTFLSSCEKDEGKLPNISFITGTGYTYADATVPKNTPVKFGINASKAEDKDVLKTYDVTRTYDGGVAAPFGSETLTGSQGDNYSKEYIVTTRDQAGTEKYIFTVVNRDGLKNTVSLTLTVH